MPEKARGSPVHRLPDWRLTLPLAQSCPRCGARTRSGAKCKAPAIQTADVGCMAGRVRGRVRRKDWNECDAPTHGMAIIRRKAAGSYRLSVSW